MSEGPDVAAIRARLGIWERRVREATTQDWRIVYRAAARDIASLLQALEAAKRRAEHVDLLLVAANDVLRSVYSVVVRAGEQTNWDALGRQVERVLDEQYAYMYPAAAAITEPEEGESDTMES